MAPQHDLEKPMDAPYSLVGGSWPSESENSYHTAKIAAEDASTAASVQSESATDAGPKMSDEHGKTADAVSAGYGTAATQLMEQARNFTTISAWMEDAAVKVLDAKRHIRHLVRTATSEIKDALASEISGTAVTPSSAGLIAKYRDDIASVAATLTTDLDAIGHSLAGDPGSSRAPSYVSVSTTPTPEHADPHAVAASYTGTPGAPAPEPQTLPEMPRATSAQNSGTPNTPSTPTAPHPMNPTLAGLISPQASASSGSPSSNGVGTPSTSAGTSSASQPQGHQAPEQQRQTPKAPGLPGIPNIPLPNVAAAAESIATAVTSAANGTQLPTTTPASTAPQAPASTGFTPGSSGAAPTAPVTPGLGPIGGLSTPPAVLQLASPTAQAPPAGAQTPQQVSTPAPRGPVVTAEWLQRTYGLAPGVELPKSETALAPALFITDLPESEAHLHRTLATLRQAFEQTNWSQPLAVATIRRGLETRCVYATSDALSIWPQEVLLPTGVAPLDEMPNTPATSELAGSLMVTDKLRSLIPRGWIVEHLLSTVPGSENSQSIEQFQELVESGELLPCKDSRGRDDVTEDEAVQAFAMAVLGQSAGGISDLDTDSVRLKSARWVGTQPAGYLDVLSRWYLSDATEAMSCGRWGEAVHAIEKFQSVRESKVKAA